MWTGRASTTPRAKGCRRKVRRSTGIFRWRSRKPLGTITRSRSKTGHKGGQEVTYPLWPETLSLLADQCQPDGLALLTEAGKPLTNNRGVPRYDTIQGFHGRLTEREGLAAVPLKRFRATADDVVAMHARRAKTSGDTMMEKYAGRPWAKVRAATDELRVRLAEVFAEVG